MINILFAFCPNKHISIDEEKSIPYSSKPKISLALFLWFDLISFLLLTLSSCSLVIDFSLSSIFPFSNIKLFILQWPFESISGFMMKYTTENAFKILIQNKFHSIQQQRQPQKTHTHFFTKKKKLNRNFCCSVLKSFFDFVYICIFICIYKESSTIRLATTRLISNKRMSKAKRTDSKNLTDLKWLFRAKQRIKWKWIKIMYSLSKARTTKLIYCHIWFRRQHTVQFATFYLFSFHYITFFFFFRWLYSSSLVLKAPRERL